MPGQDLNVYLRQQQQTQDTQFLDQLRATGVDPESYRSPDGSKYYIPISDPNPMYAQQAPTPEGAAGPLKRGLDQMGQDFASAASLLTGAVGAEDWSKYFQGKADSLQQSIDANPSAVPTFEDVHGMGDLASYIYERTVENVPMIASLLIPGAVVGRVAKLATWGQKALKAGSVITSATGAETVGGALGWSAAALTDVGLQIGEEATATREGGHDPMDIRVIGTGLGKAVLDFLPIFAIAKSTGIAPIFEKNFLTELGKKGYLKRVAGQIPTIAAVEVPTEVAQEALSIALQRSMEQKEGDLTDEEWSRLKNAAAGALAVSVGIGPAAGLGRPRVADVVPPETPPSAEFSLDQIPKPEKPTLFLTGPGDRGGPGGPPGGTSFFVNPEGVASSNLSVFDSAGFYNPATGRPKITGDELRRALIESGSQIKYSPETDAIVNPGYSKSWKSTTPTWIATEHGGAKLGEDAEITTSIVDGKPAWDVWNVFGTQLGTYGSLPEAMQRGEEYASWRTPKVGIDINGLANIIRPVSGERVAADLAKNNPNPTKTDLIMVSLDEAKTRADKAPDEWTMPRHEELALQLMDPGYQRLLEVKEDILNDKSLYTKTGELTKKAQKQLDTVNSRIVAFTEKIGIPGVYPTDKGEIPTVYPVGRQQIPTLQGAPAGTRLSELAPVKNGVPTLNPFTQEYVLEKGRDVEDQLQEIAARETIKRSAPKHKNLTAAESNLHDQLMEKEIIQGLSDREMDILLDLQEKAKEGEPVQMYRKPNKEELEEIRADINDVDKILRMEEKRAKKQQKGQKFNLDEDGNYMFSRVGNTLDFPKFDVEEAEGGYIIKAKGKGEIGKIIAVQDGYMVSLLIPGKGGLHASLRKDSPQMRIGLSGIAPEHQGQGYGRALYEAAAMEAKKLGRNLTSDTLVSTQAQKMYGKLEESGYQVERNPNVTTMQAEGGKEYAASTDQRPIFFVKTLRAAVGAIRVHAQEVLAPSTNFDKLRETQKSLTREQVNDAVIKMYQNLVIKPLVRIAYISEFPKGKMRDFAASSAGFIDFDNAGMVTLIADNIFSNGQAQQVLAHEVILHYGIRAFMNPKELTFTLSEVLKYRAKEIWENKRARGELQDMDSGFSKDVLNLRDAEEFLAGKMEEAWIRWQAGDKAWMQDNIWEKPGEKTFVEKMIAFFRRVFSRIGWSTRPWNDHEIASMLKDISLFMSGKLSGREAVGLDAHWKTDAMRSAVGREPLSVAIPNINSFSSVWGAKFATLFLTPLQIAEKSKSLGLRSIWNKFSFGGREKGDLTTESVGIAEDWQKMPKREMSNMSAAIFDIDSKSAELERRLTTPEVQSITKEYGLGETAIKMIERIDKQFQTMLQKLQHGLEFNAIAEHTRDTPQARELHELWAKGDRTAFYNRSKEVLGNLEIGGRLVTIANEMAILRNRNYFPHMRFGKYAMYIRAKEDLTYKGRDYKGKRGGREGQVVYFETFENYAAREARSKELIQEFPSRVYDYGHGIINDAEFTFLGMPPSLYEALGSKLNLTAEQADALKELYFTRSPGRSFLKHLTKRKGTEGYSQDALRTFATYMMNASNHIARVEYHREMGAALTELKAAGQKMGDVAGIIRNYFGNHFEYIMNPAGDWASIRGIGFLWYLGFNVKSALVNLTQVPMVAYPYLASQYGDARSVGALSKAYGTVVRLMRGQSVLDDAAQVDINRAFAEGVIDQAQATELAAISESPVLQRLLPTNRGQKLISELGYYGSWAFRHAETFNRRVVFLAARDLAIQKGLKGEDVFLAAKKAVQTSMFEYSKWNRPQYSQGKKSVFFLSGTTSSI